MLSLKHGVRITSIYIATLLLLCVLPALTACDTSHCTGCNFEASNLSLSTSGTFLFSPVTSQSVKVNGSTSFQLSIISDQYYSGDVNFSFLYPDIRQIDPNSTIRFTAVPQAIHLNPNEVGQILITITTTSASPVLNSGFYVTAVDATQPSQMNPYLATVTVPLSVTRP